MNNEREKMNEMNRNHLLFHEKYNWKKVKVNRIELVLFSIENIIELVENVDGEEFLLLWKEWKKLLV